METIKDSASELTGNQGGKGHIWHFLPKSHQHHKIKDFLEGLN